MRYRLTAIILGLVLVSGLAGVVQSAEVLPVRDKAPAPWERTGTYVFIRNINFVGNTSIPSEILLQMMNMVTNSVLDYGQVRSAVERVTSFYARQGYTLTKVVSSHVRLDGVLEIAFDEGRINRILILNKNIYSIYSFKQELQINEGDVFNHISIEQELERIRRKFSLKGLSYTIKANPAIEGSFDLYVTADSWKGRLFGFVLDNDEFSLVPRVSFKEYDFWGLDHEIALSAEARISWLKVTRWRGSMDYYFPSFLGEQFRPFVHLEKTFEKKSRKDIDLSYWEDNFIVGLFMENRVGNTFRIRSGLIHNHYRIFDLETGATPEAIATASYDKLGYYQAQLVFEFSHPENRYRRDKHFLARLSLDYSIHEHEDNFLMLKIEIRKAFVRKLDDIMFRYYEMHIFNESGFYRDYDLTDFMLRGYDGGEFFSRHAWMLSSEYRLSVYHDIIKYLFFVDSAVYLPVSYDHGTRNGRLKLRTSVGQGIEFNIHEWSAKIYYGMPAHKEVLDGKVHLMIQKVF